MALISSPYPLQAWRFLRGDGDINDFDYPPNNVEDSWKHDAYEQKNKRIIEYALHGWYWFRRLNVHFFVTHGPFPPINECKIQA